MTSPSNIALSQIHLLTVPSPHLLLITQKQSVLSLNRESNASYRVRFMGALRSDNDELYNLIEAHSNYMVRVLHARTLHHLCNEVQRLARWRRDDTNHSAPQRSSAEMGFLLDLMSVMSLQDTLDIGDSHTIDVTDDDALSEHNDTTLIASSRNLSIQPPQMHPASIDHILLVQIQDFRELKVGVDADIRNLVVQWREFRVFREFDLFSLPESFHFTFADEEETTIAGSPISNSSSHHPSMLSHGDSLDNKGHLRIQFYDMNFQNCIMECKLDLSQALDFHLDALDTDRWLRLHDASQRNDYMGMIQLRFQYKRQRFAPAEKRFYDRMQQRYQREYEEDESILLNETSSAAVSADVSQENFIDGSPVHEQQDTSPAHSETFPVEDSETLHSSPVDAPQNETPNEHYGFDDALPSPFTQTPEAFAPPPQTETSLPLHSRKRQSPLLHEQQLPTQHRKSPLQSRLEALQESVRSFSPQHQTIPPQHAYDAVQPEPFDSVSHVELPRHSRIFRGRPQSDTIANLRFATIERKREKPNLRVPLDYMSLAFGEKPRLNFEHDDDKARHHQEPMSVSPRTQRRSVTITPRRANQLVPQQQDAMDQDNKQERIQQLIGAKSRGRSSLAAAGDLLKTLRDFADKMSSREDPQMSFPPLDVATPPRGRRRHHAPPDARQASPSAAQQDTSPKERSNLPRPTPLHIPTTPNGLSAESDEPRSVSPQPEMQQFPTLPPRPQPTDSPAEQFSPATPASLHAIPTREVRASPSPLESQENPTHEFELSDDYVPLPSTPPQPQRNDDPLNLRTPPQTYRFLEQQKKAAPTRPPPPRPARPPIVAPTPMPNTTTTANDDPTTQPSAQPSATTIQQQDDRIKKEIDKIKRQLMETKNQVALYTQRGGASQSVKLLEIEQQKLTLKLAKLSKEKSRLAKLRG